MTNFARVAGLYIHIPFCAKKCTYCDFHFSVNYHSYRSQMIDNLEKEMTLRKSENNLPLQTVYFGGGTPSLLGRDELSGLIAAAQSTWGIAPEAEITLECNPDDCTPQNLADWKMFGINRLSIGIQTLDREQLGWMNRTHTVEEGRNVVRMATQAGFRKFTVDLIYGLPGQTVEQWKHTLEEVMDWGINHLSAYCLTVEPGTALEKWISKGKLAEQDEDLQADQFEALQEMAEKFGFEQYEVSNFARNGEYSAHNTSYWKGEKYIGIGPSAHGFNGKERYWNVRNNHLYMKQIGENTLPETKELLSPADQFNELLLIGLRTKWGADKSRLFEYLPPSPEWLQLLSDYEKKGDLRQTRSNIVLTESGLLRADAIAASLFVGT